MRICASRQEVGCFNLNGLSRQELVNLINALEVFKGRPHWFDCPWTRGMQAKLQTAIDAHDAFYYASLSPQEGGA